jgi:predicted dehydrogenase
VFCEKPLALTVDEADEMVAAFIDGELVLSLVMNHRYSPDNIRVKRAVQDGAIGRILMGSVLHSSALTGNDDGSSPWRGRRGRAAGGILTTQAIHFLDLLLWFAGPVAGVKAWTANLSHPGLDFEDTGALALRLRSGAIATLVTTNGTPIFDDFTGTRIELHGTDGYVLLEGDELRLSSFREGYVPPDVRQPPPPEGADVLFGHGHIHEIADFVRAARQGAPVPVPGADARHLMAVLSAAYRSAGTDADVALDPDDPAYADASPPTTVRSRGGVK